MLRKTLRVKNRLLLTIVLLASTSAISAPDIYRRPEIRLLQPGDEAMDCLALERELTTLAPLRYSFKPGFFEDPYHGASLAVGTTIGWPAYSVLGYSYLVGIHDQQRIIETENRIATLRSLKAERHCFEH